MDMPMKSLMVSLVVILMSIMNLTKAQCSVASCTQSLIPCFQYINSTKPPISCCAPLKEAFETQLQCLCNIFNTPGLLQSFNVHATDALALGHHCGITIELSNCSAGSAPSPSISSSSVPPAATREVHSGEGRVSFTGISFLLLFWVSMLF